MTKKINHGILFSSVLTLAACLVFFVGVQYQMYDDTLKSSLENKAEIISRNADESELEAYGGIKERVTLISKDGKVLFDNKAKASEMGSHAKRKEVKNALKNGEGYDIRRSETLGVKTCYYALKLKDGNILRVSEDAMSLLAVISGLIPAICAIAVMTVILAAVLADIISKKIIKPINNMNLENPEYNDAYDELSPFITKINDQNKRIRHQIAELKRSRLEFDTIAENMTEGLCLTDKNGKVIMHNSGFEKIFGPDSDIDGNNILTFCRDESFRKTLENIRESEKSENLLVIGGKSFEITANPVFDENGSACGAAILIVDVTEKEKREKLRREFTANVSHELKTPLTSILGISDMMKNGIVKEEDIKSFASDINNEASRLITLVNDIIKLSRLDEEKENPEDAETVDLNEISREVVKSLSPVADKKRIKLNLSGEKAEIQGGRSLIFEMVYNLCDNAVKYNRDGGSAEIITGTENGKPFVTVKDTGIGIPQDKTDRIFERFYRVDKSRSKSSGGTGLGLSIVKHIALSLGGEISVSSELDKGTEIKIVFDKKFSEQPA